MSRGTVRAQVRVTRTDDELMIARSVVPVLERGAPRHAEP